MNDHPQLYHYTTESGLKGILESNALRATYFADLNDSQEIRELRVPFVDELTRRLLPFVHEQRKLGLRASERISKAGGNMSAAARFSRSWVNALYRTTFDAEAQAQTLCCITSFCSHANDQEYEKNNGLLSQWRGYGRDGGFCLVFDTAEISKQLAKERTSYFYLYTHLRPTHYYLEEAALTPEFSDLISLSERILKSAIVGDRDFNPQEVFEPFVTTATTYKHRGFYEEREVRIIAMAATEATVEKIKNLPGYKDEPLKRQFVAERNGAKRHYIELFGKGFSALPLLRVIVGPSSEQERNFQLAKQLVGGGVTVSKSATPFIG